MKAFIYIQYAQYSTMLRYNSETTGEEIDFLSV